MTSADTTTGLPSGYVTFVITDIEGSTRLFRDLGESYADLLAKHNELLRTAFFGHGGVEIRTEGDSLFVAFEDSTEAVVACLEAQIALTAYPWPSGAPVKVRMGIHAGEAEPSEGDYVSLVVHQVARISSGAHGGQILVSEEVARDVESRLPDAAELTLLGSFQLRGFPQPAKLFQVDHPDLAADFPPLRAIGVVAHNLPFVRTSFVGRARERAALARLLQATGVVTIVGAGGVGKTRLALQVAFDVMGDYEHGAWLIDLVPVTGSASLVRAIAAAMGLGEKPGQDATTALLETLSTREALLILDNCEHVIDDTAALAELLSQRCPNLTVLATSREPLDIDAEAVWRVEPLSITAGDGETPDAVRLFTERAQLAQPGFELTDDNQAQVQDIVWHLNGIPLAIELAAAALGERSLASVVDGLSDRFSLLTRGRRTAPDRHQTLKAALEWSLDLLKPHERRLFQRLAAFAGSGSVIAATEVCAGEPVEASEVASLIGRLTRASLLVTVPEHIDRWLMLESLRHLARLELAEIGELETIEARHRSWFLDLVENLSPEIGGEHQARAMKELDLDRQNIHWAIDTAISVGDSETSLRTGSAMAPFWTSHGDWAEGSERLRGALALDSDDLALRAHAEVALGRLLLLSGDLAEASEAFDAGLADAIGGGDDLTRARALSGTGYVAFRRSDLDTAESRWAEALELAESVAEDRVIAEVLRSFAIAVASKGDQTRAGELLRRAMDAAERAGDNQLLRLLLGSWGELNLWLGRYVTASDAYGDALSLATDIGDISARPLLLAELGWMALLSGDPVKAGALAVEAIEFAEDLHSLRVLAHSLRLSGEALLRTGDHHGSAEALDRALEVANELSAPAEVAGVLCSQAFRSLHLLDDESAARLALEAVGMGGIGHTMRQVLPQWILGVTELHAGRLDEAEERFEEVLAQADQAQLARHRASATWGLAEVSAARGAGDAASRHLDGLDLRIEIDDRLGIADSLVGLARTLGPEAGQLAEAATQLRAGVGASATLWEVSLLDHSSTGDPSSGPLDLEHVHQLATDLVKRKEHDGMVGG